MTNDEMLTWQRRSDNWMIKLPPYPADTSRGRGVVIAAGGPRYFTCAWVCVRMLQALGCDLPIEFWYLGPSEMDEKMRDLAINQLGVTRCVDGFDVAKNVPEFHFGERPGWQLKALSLLMNGFDEVLYLDADNVPVLNPAPLFDTPQYQETGAIFWPDYGRLAASRVIWKLCGVVHRDEPEFESGQIVVDKRRCWSPLWLSLHYNVNSHFYYKHIWGDKDTFHMAWHRARQRYSMPPFAIFNLANKVMCQHDFQGRVIFQHRNLAKWHMEDRHNPKIGGFQHEDKCRGFIRELVGVWNGQLKLPVPKSKSEKTEAAELLKRSTYIYNRVGHDRRNMEFLSDQTIGMGAADCERNWHLVERKDGTTWLVISGNNANTAELRRRDDIPGAWYGHWLINERMPVELLPTSQGAQIQRQDEETFQRERLMQQKYVYVRINHDKRLLELKSDGTVGEGAGDSERTWELHRGSHGQLELILNGKEGITCMLRENADGVWRGRWVVAEKMAVNLVPIPEQQHIPPCKEQPPVASEA